MVDVDRFKDILEGITLPSEEEFREFYDSITQMPEAERLACVKLVSDILLLKIKLRRFLSP